MHREQSPSMTKQGEAKQEQEQLRDGMRRKCNGNDGRRELGERNFWVEEKTNLITKSGGSSQSEVHETIMMKHKGNTASINVHTHITTAKPTNPARNARPIIPIAPTTPDLVAPPVLDDALGDDPLAVPTGAVALADALVLVVGKGHRSVDWKVVQSLEAGIAERPGSTGA